MAENGTDNISLRKIAAECGVSCAAPYKHFEDKARLLHNWSERFSEGDPWFSVNFSRDPKRAALYKFDPFDYEAI